MASVRITLFLLVFANAAWFAWARWIDIPPTMRVGAVQELPALRLASEVGIDKNAASSNALLPAIEEPPARCVSVGPFDDLGAAARAAATLQERGLSPRQRAEQGAGWTGFWVYVDGFTSAQDRSRALRRLERGGIADAHAMPESSDSRRISLGVFSERARADRRARAVARLGMQPEIAERTQTGAAYWIDFDLTTRDSAIAAEGLLSTNPSGARIEIRACPTAIERPVLANSAR
jgi:hypothetical protein